MTEFFDVAQYAAVILILGLLVTLSVAFYLENNSIIDVAYGALFVLIAWCLALPWSEWGLRQEILLAGVTLWGLRLAYRIGRKNWQKPEDFRYRTWREEWKKRGMLYFFFRSLFQIYVLQGLVVLVVSLPVLIAFSTTQYPLEWWNWAGIGVWCLGFFFEVMGDWQLDRFIRNPAHAGQIMATGLWRYTRHPNYFGEALMWWGLFLLVLGLPFSHWAIASPMLITFLLTQVSGIPMLEARWAGRPDWEEYKRKTSAFIPWLPKKESV